MAQKLSVQIALEGSKEVERQLASLGEEGKKAFQEISKAAEVAGGFKNLKLSEINAQLKELGITGADSINQIKDAVKTAARFETLTQGAVKSEQALAALKNTSKEVAAASGAVAAASTRATAAFGLTRRELGALRTALRQVDLGPIGNQLTSLGRIGSAFGRTGIGLAGIGGTIGGLIAMFDSFANSAKKTATALDEMSKAGGASFEFLSSMQIAFAQGGTSLENFAKEFGGLQEKIRAGGFGVEESMHRLEQASLGVKAATQSVASASLSLAEARARAQSVTGQLSGAEEQYFARVRRFLAVRQAQLALQQAKLKQDEAEREEAKAQANNITALIQKFQGLANGFKQTFDPLTTLESKVKAVSALLSKLPQEDQFAKLADIFKNLSLIDRAQLGKALGLSPETIDTLSKGSAALRAMQEEARRLGIALDELDKINLNELKSATNGLAALWQALKDKMGALVSPAILSFFQGFSERIKELTPQFLELARRFGAIDFTAVGRAVADLTLKLADFAVKLTQAIEEVSRVGFKALEEKFASLGQSIMSSIRLQPGGIADQIISGFKAALDWLAANSGIGERFWNSVGNAAVNAWNAIITVIQSAISWIRSFTTQHAGILWATVSDAAVNAWNAIITVIMNAITWVTTFAQSIVSIVWDNISSAGVAAWNALAAAIQRAIDNMRQLQAPSATLPEPGGIPMASGGLMGGRGTGTSDSNLAWLSRGEHIMPARAVAQPGVLAFLEALRRSGGNLRNVLDGMGRFALGGLVPRPAYAFAAGGPVGGMSNVTINFPGTPPISGLRASVAVVDELRKAAALAQVRSGGRKPSRYS